MRTVEMHRGAVFLGLAGAVALASVGCSPSPPTGVLGNGQFRYLCEDQGSLDTACAGSAFDVDLPGAIAVGSTFGIGYAPNSATGPVQGETGYEIVPASPLLASSSGTTIAALRAGYVALLARHVGNADVDDFVHLRFSAIQTLVVPPSPMEVSASVPHVLSISALDALGAPLAGKLLCQWQVTSGAPAIALEGTPTSSSATLEAATAGAVGSLHVSCGGAQADIAVTITGPNLPGGYVPPEPPEGGLP
jgi:hypothetical protein